MKQIVRKLSKIIVTCLVFTAAFFLVHLPHGPEHWSTDLRTAWLSDRLNSSHPSIVIVEISERTLKNSKYLSPVDRLLLARLIKNIDSGNPQVIGLDFIFDRPTEKEKDEYLIDTLKSAKNRIVLGYAARDALEETGASYQREFIGRTGRSVGHLYFGQHRNPLVISDEVVREVRHAPLDGVYASFSKTISESFGQARDLETDYISWLGPPADGSDVFSTLPAEVFLDQNIETVKEVQAFVRGKAVLIGGNFVDRDRHFTPFSVLRGNSFPGISIHAQSLAQYIDLDRRQIHVISIYVTLLLALIAVVIGFATERSHALRSFSPGTELLFVVVLVAIGTLAFLYGRFVFPFISIFLAWKLGELLAHSFAAESKGMPHETVHE